MRKEVRKKGLVGGGAAIKSHHIGGLNTCRDAPANGVVEASCCSSRCRSACCCGGAACWGVGAAPLWNPGADP